MKLRCDNKRADDAVAAFVLAVSFADADADDDADADAFVQVGESSRSSEVEAFLERCGEEAFAPNLHRECR